MGFKNYTTTILVSKTIGEIQEILASHGAKQILCEYESGQITRISFVFPTTHGDIGVRLPAKLDAVYKIMLEQKKTGEIKTKVDKEQAAKTAWRNIKDWLDAQMALVETNQVKMEQIFFFCTLNNQEQTLYEVYERRLLATPQDYPDSLNV